jgi:tight adherence protein C
MNPTYIFGGLLVMFALVAVAGFFLVEELTRQQRLTKRLELVATGGEVVIEEVKRPEGSQLLAMISSFGMLIVRTGVLSNKTILEINATLEGVGFKGGRGIGLFIGAKVLCFILFPMIAYFCLSNFLGTTEFWTCVKVGGAAILGLLTPETLAKNHRAKHLEKVQAGVADALDMLVICADAGLALEAGLARVSQEMAQVNPNLAQELRQTSQELSIGSDMRLAMDSLGQRTGLETLKRLAATLSQSLQYGTPLTAALRSLSAELREEALTAFQERAGRLPTLMTVPMILFILPCVFLIVAGPAIINVLQSFSK